MTTYEIYNQAIKSLYADERLHIARLILDDLAPDSVLYRPGYVRDLAHMEQLLLDGLNSGPMAEANNEYWEQKQQRMTARLSPA